MNLSQLYQKAVIEYEQALPILKQDLEHVCLSHSIKLSSIKYRIKSLSSLEQKYTRKRYSSFSQVTDIAGIRIVCLFVADIPRILDIIRRTYTVLEKAVNKQDVTEFSYQKNHVLIQKNSLVFEIQIKTILQDAWGELEHYLHYKQQVLSSESVRKLHALSALFEVAQDQFEDIYGEYQSTTQLQDISLSPQTLYQFTKKTFDWAWKDVSQHAQLESLTHYEQLCAQFLRKGITRIDQLESHYLDVKDEIILKELGRITEVTNAKSAWPQMYKKIELTGHFYTPFSYYEQLLLKLDEYR
jgi:ppGpp synthetase/RelA/SpoT-type nucleotidyltranferase